MGRLVFALLLAAYAAGEAVAQYPLRPVRLVVPASRRSHPNGCRGNGSESHSALHRGTRGQDVLRCVRPGQQNRDTVLPKCMAAIELPQTGREDAAGFDEGTGVVKAA